MTITPVGSSELLAELGEEFQQLADDLDTVDQNAADILVAVAQSVQAQTYIAKGRIISEFRDKNKDRLKADGGWLKFLAAKNLSRQTVEHWVHAYQCYEENKEVYGEENLLGFGGYTLAKLHKGVSSSTLGRVLSSGQCTQREAAEIIKDPKEKLLKAQEDLEAAKEKRAAAENKFNKFTGTRNTVTNPEYQKVNSEKQSAVQTVRKLQSQITKLKEQVQLEQDKTSAAEAAKDKAEEQLNQVMFDEDTSKDLQVKRVGYNLQNMVPQVLADSQRYLSEKGRYPEELRFHIDQQLTQLLTYLQTHYGN